VEKKIVQRREQLEAQQGKAVRVWAMEEHRVGLKPTVAREGFPWWQVPIAPVHWRFLFGVGSMDLLNRVPGKANGGFLTELQPAERLWPLIDEGVINQVFESLEELEEAIARRCRQLGSVVTRF